MHASDIALCLDGLCWGPRYRPRAAPAGWPCCSPARSRRWGAPQSSHTAAAARRWGHALRHPPQQDPCMHAHIRRCIITCDWLRVAQGRVKGVHRGDMKRDPASVMRRGHAHHWQSATVATPASSASRAKAAPAYCEVHRRPVSLRGAQRALQWSRVTTACSMHAAQRTTDTGHGLRRAALSKPRAPVAQYMTPRVSATSATLHRRQKLLVPVLHALWLAAAKCSSRPR